MNELIGKVGELFLSQYPFLDANNPLLWVEASKEARIFLDEILRPISSVGGRKALDAYRFFHDQTFMPLEWVVEEKYLPISFVRGLALDPMSFFRPEDDWEQKKPLQAWPDDSYWAVVMISHRGLLGRREMVWEFLRATKERHPQLYERVVQKVIGEAERQR